MATVKLFIKGFKGKDAKKNPSILKNPSTIYLRFAQGKTFDFTKSTSLFINPVYWDEKITGGEIKGKSIFNGKVKLQNTLNDLKNNILNKYNIDYSNGVLINSFWLETQIFTCLNQTSENDLVLLLNYAEHYLKNLPNKIKDNGVTGVSESTIKKFQTIVNKIKTFEKNQNKRFKITDVDIKFHKDFIYYLHNVEKLNFNTTGKYLMFIKTIILDAKKNGYSVSPDILKKEFRATKEKTYFVVLSENEIDLIFYHDFSKNTKLDNARNWLIMGLWTGARAGDLLNFTEKKIKNNFIEYVAEKTEQKIILPIHWQVKSILEKCNGVPYKISTQKYNDYIKLVCKEIGFNEMIEGTKSIDVNNKDTTKPKKPKLFRKEKGLYKKWELISTHVARRSFATNHYGRLPTTVLMSATGHTTERQLLSYIAKSSIDNAEILQQYWNKLEQINDKKTVLKIAK